MFKKSLFFKIIGLLVSASCTLAATLENPISVPIGVYVEMGNDTGNGQTEIAEFSADLGSAGPTVYGAVGAPEYSYEELTHLDIGQNHVMTLSSEYCTDGMVYLFAPPGYQIYIDEEPVLYAEAQGTSGGTSVNEEFSVKVLPTAGYGGNSGQSLGFSLGSIHWSVGLGFIQNGKPVGELSIKEESLGASVYTPSILKFANIHLYEVTEYRPGGVLRQIITPSILVDIIDTHDSPALDGFKIRFYQRSALEKSSFNGTSYSVNSADVNDFHEEYRIEKPANNQFRIRKSKGGDGETLFVSYNYNSNNPIWIHKKGKYNASSYKWEYVETRSRGGAATLGDYLDTITIADGAGNIDFKVEKEYQVINGEEELRLSSADPDGKQYKTEYKYYTNSSNPASFQRLNWVFEPEGIWKKYDYSDDRFSFGLVSKIYEPWKSDLTHPDLAGTAGKVTRFTYVEETPIPGIGLGPIRDYPSAIVTKVKGIELGRTHFAYNGNVSFNSMQGIETTKTDYVGDGSTLVTVVKSYEPWLKNLYSGLVISVTRPDQTRSSFYYGRNGDNFVQYEFRGLKNSSSGADQMTRFDPTGAFPNNDVDDLYLVPNQSTVERIERNAEGNVVSRKSLVYTGTGSGLMDDGDFAEVSSISYSYAPGNRLTSATNSKGQSITIVYTNGVIDYAVDEHGIKTIYNNYDELNRPETVVKQGFSGISGFSQGDISTSFTYDALGRVTQEVVSGGSLSLSASREFDLARMFHEQEETEGTEGF